MKTHRQSLGAVVAVLLYLTSSCSLVKLHHDLAKQNVPIRFDGQVVDQNNHPVPDAKIAAFVRQWYVPGVVIPDVRGRMIHFNKETAADGRFELRGVTGDAVQIESIQKDGYQLDRNTQLGYGAVAGSPTNPVIFKMWAQTTQ